MCTILVNSADDEFILKRGQRCCQGVFLPTHDADFTRVDVLEKTERNNDGFGSTDTRDAGVQSEV